MPSPLIPGLHCRVYEPAGRSTVSSADVPRPTFSRSPTMLPSGRRTYSSLTRLPVFCRRSVTVPAGSDVDAGVHAVSVAVTVTAPLPDADDDVAAVEEEQAPRARAATGRRSAAA